MAIRSDSYGSVDEVAAFSQYLFDGNAVTFKESTQPTLTQVEKFIDRASSHINLALAEVGLTIPVTNTTAKLSLDDWVVSKAVEYVELTQRGAGFNDNENTRHISFRSMRKDAKEFVSSIRTALVDVGVTVNRELSRDLAFTGLTIQEDRTDPDDTGKEQPKFIRGQFEND